MKLGISTDRASLVAAILVWAFVIGCPLFTGFCVSRAVRGTSLLLSVAVAVLVFVVALVFAEPIWRLLKRLFAAPAPNELGKHSASPRKRGASLISRVIAN